MTILMKALFSKGISAEEYTILQELPVIRVRPALRLLALPLTMGGGRIEKHNLVFSQDAPFHRFGDVLRCSGLSAS